MRILREILSLYSERDFMDCVLETGVIDLLVSVIHFMDEEAKSIFPPFSQIHSHDHQLLPSSLRVSN